MLSRLSTPIRAAARAPSALPRSAALFRVPFQRQYQHQQQQQQRQFACGAGCTHSRHGGWLWKGAAVLGLAGVAAWMIRPKTALAAGDAAAPASKRGPPSQTSVYSPGKNHASYVWIHLSPTADPKKAAAIAASLPSVVAKVAPAGADEDQEILAGVAFGPAFAAAAGLKAPHNFKMEDRQGPVGNMPATGGDIFFHIKSNTQSHVFDVARQMVDAFPPGYIASVDDRYGWVYRNGRDLSGFIDGTENPASEDDRYDAAVIPQTGGSYVLTQRWVHNLHMDKVADTKTQETYVGRSKDNSVENNPLHPNSHVARMNGKDATGKKINIVRQSMPYGTLGDVAGLFFIAYFNDPAKINYMLDRMTGTGTATDKQHDNVMRFSKAVSGNIWYVPSAAELAGIKA